MVDLNALIGTIMSGLPGIVAMIKANHAAKNPDAPPLTDAEVFEALQKASADSLAKDEEWLASHPSNPPGQ